jgi:hypothetical protein
MAIPGWSEEEHHPEVALVPTSSVPSTPNLRVAGACAAFARQSLEHGSVGPGIVPRQVPHLLTVDMHCDSVSVVLVVGLSNEPGNAPMVMTVDGLATADARERLLVVRFTDDRHLSAATQLDRADLERLAPRRLSPGVPLE